MLEPIEVYIRTEEILTSESITGRPIFDGVTIHYCTMKETAKKEKVIPEADRLALEVVKEFADSKGIRVEVCDVSTLRGKLRARSRGIKTIPTIVVCGNRIEGEQVAKLSRSILESCAVNIE
jgi:hypothetical protein